MELNKEQIIKAIQDCIDRPKCIDCPNLTLCAGHGFEYLLVNALSLIKELTEDVERVTKQCGEIIVECDERDAERLKQVAELTEENERLRADKKGLINENEELKNQIQEPYFTEEEIDFIDEYTRLLNEGIRDAKANNVSEIKTRFAMRFGTYTDKDMTPITEVFRFLDQIAKEIINENNS